MNRESHRPTKAIGAILATYLLSLAVAIRWHWRLGPPHTQATLPLLVAFGLCAALVGLSSVSVAIATLHWTRRVSGFLVGVAILGFYWTPHFAWNAFLLWQLLVMFAAQTACLLVVLGIASSAGWSLVGPVPADHQGPEPRSKHAWQLSITDFLIFAAALALLCAMMRGSTFVELSTLVYLLNAAGGACAALVALAVLWACFGTAPALPRMAALALVAPMGGAVYVLAEPYATLLF